MLYSLSMHSVHSVARSPSLCKARRSSTLPNVSRLHLHKYPARLHATVARAAVPKRSPTTEAAILTLTDSLRLLETERDEAVGTAESCARTAVKLDEMTRLLERLAVDKVAEGDESGARQVLQEKAAVSEVLSRTSTRANTNFALAAKLAEKIGQQQAELMGLLAPAGTKTPTAAPASSSTPSPQRSSTTGYGTSSSSSSYASSPATTTRTASSDSSSISPGGASPSGYEAPWERSLAEARARIQQVEQEAAAAGQRAAWKGRESVEEARDRLRTQAMDSVAAARSRIRASATESIEQARARIAAEDAAVLAEVHNLVARYKAGGYVPEADLDWAFRQLERRSWR